MTEAKEVMRDGKIDVLFASNKLESAGLIR